MMSFPFCFASIGGGFSHRYFFLFVISHLSTLVRSSLTCTPRPDKSCWAFRAPRCHHLWRPSADPTPTSQCWSSWPWPVRSPSPCFRPASWTGCTRWWWRSRRRARAQTSPRSAGWWPKRRRPWCTSASRWWSSWPSAGSWSPSPSRGWKKKSIRKLLFELQFTLKKYEIPCQK